VPVEFLSDEQAAAYGRFDGELSSAELVTRDLPARQLLAHREPRSGTARRQVTSGGVPSDETLGITVDGSA